MAGTHTGKFAALAGLAALVMTLGTQGCQVSSALMAAAPLLAGATPYPGQLPYPTPSILGAPNPVATWQQGLPLGR